MRKCEASCQPTLKSLKDEVLAKAYFEVKLQDENNRLMKLLEGNSQKSEKETLWRQKFEQQEQINHRLQSKISSMLIQTSQNPEISSNKTTQRKNSYISYEQSAENPERLRDLTATFENGGSEFEREYHEFLQRNNSYRSLGKALKGRQSKDIQQILCKKMQTKEIVIRITNEYRNSHRKMCFY